MEGLYPDGMCVHPSARLNTLQADVPFIGTVVLALIVYPYLPFVYFLSYHTMYQICSRPIHALFQTATYHALLGMTLWCYHSASFTLPGSPAGVGGPTGEYTVLPEEEEEGIGLAEFAREHPSKAGASANVPLGLMAKSSSGEPRFCRKCGVGKPDRSVISF